MFRRCSVKRHPRSHCSIEGFARLLDFFGALVHISVHRHPDVGMPSDSLDGFHVHLGRRKLRQIGMPQDMRRCAVQVDGSANALPCTVEGAFGERYMTRLTCNGARDCESKLIMGLSGKNTLSSCFPKTSLRKNGRSVSLMESLQRKKLQALRHCLYGTTSVMRKYMNSARRFQTFILYLPISILSRIYAKHSD